jgi:hypothetical protein
MSRSATARDVRSRADATASLAPVVGQAAGQDIHADRGARQSEPSEVIAHADRAEDEDFPAAGLLGVCAVFFAASHEHRNAAQPVIPMAGRLL